MTAQRFTSKLLLTTAAAAAALVLAGCGTGTPQSQTSSTQTSSTPAPSAAVSSAAAPTSQPAETPTSAAPATSAPAAAVSTPAAGPALCKTAGLTAATDATGGGAAGSVYIQLILTNSGTEPCLLKGFAGVSLTAGPNGEPIGAPAARDASTPRRAARPGQGGTATLRYTQARNYADCTVVPAAGFRIYPPRTPHPCSSPNRMTPAATPAPMY
ncbi:DUF4232 domain-containing protein [Pseudarthrobacter sp. So.54]